MTKARNDETDGKADNAGNRELPPAILPLPGDDSQVNLGSLPTVPDMSSDLGTPAQPSAQPSTNPLFVEAEQSTPAPTPGR